MIKKIEIEEQPIILQGPFASEDPLYFYLSPERDFLLYSSSLKALLESPLIKKPLTLSEEALSFYLLSGVIPTPRTIFKEIHVLSLGDSVCISKNSQSFQVSFSHEFPYPNHRRGEGDFKEDYLLELLRKKVEEKVSGEKAIYLFQSLGKDSNTIALALSTSPLKETIICLTLSTGDKKDESFVAGEIAKKLGFKSEKLFIPSKIEKNLWDNFVYYFQNISHPCIDGTSLVYPLYACQMNFSESYVIDGSGNDVYFGHVPRPIEYKRQRWFTLFEFLRPLSDLLTTGNPLQGLTKCRAEWIGLSGFTFSDAQKIYPHIINVYPYWKGESKKREKWDYFDLKADLWGTYVEFDLVMRKVRNFGEVFGAEVIFPWYTKEIAEYIGKLPENLLFDRKSFRNKLPLRELLKKHLNLDSDRLGKYSYGFNALNFLLKIEKQVKEEIFNCELWNKRESEKIYRFLRERVDRKLFGNLLIRLFILSAWYNHNKYLRSIEERFK